MIRPECNACHEEIDPEVCWCGSYENDSEHNGYNYTHPFIPMGCECFRAKPDVREPFNGDDVIDDEDCPYSGEDADPLLGDT